MYAQHLHNFDTTLLNLFLMITGYNKSLKYYYVHKKTYMYIQLSTVFAVKIWSAYLS